MTQVESAVACPRDCCCQSQRVRRKCPLCEPKGQLCGLETEQSPVRNSNHSQLFLLDSSAYKVQTVPDILQMPHNGQQLRISASFQGTGIGKEGFLALRDLYLKGLKIL